MERKPNGSRFISNNSQAFSRKVNSHITPRSASLFGISRYDDDDRDNYHFQNGVNSYIGDQYEIQHYKTNHYLTNKTTSFVEKRSSREDNNSSIQENFSGVLREKMPNNGMYTYSHNEPWLCDVDIYQEKLKGQRILNQSSSNQQHQQSPLRQHYSTKLRFSESEKDRKVTVLDETFKRRIQTRSESEPNDIRNLQYFIPQRDVSAERKDRHFNNYESVNSMHECSMSIYKKAQLPPKPPYNNLSRESPLRVVTYNQTGNSFGCSRKVGRFRSPSILSSPRINNLRRSKAKSPSPRRKTIESLSTFRKARSTTPPAKLKTNKILTMPIRNRTFSDNKSVSIKSSQMSSLPKAEGSADDVNDDDGDDDDNSSLEDDDDFEDEADDGVVNISSDSEDGYKVHVYLNNSEKSFPSPNFILSSNIVPIKLTSPFVPSLFPYVPPYLAFSTNTEKGPPMPPELHKILKWKLTSVMPKVVRHVVLNSGFRLLKKTNDWMGTWGKHMKSPCFKAIRPYQKINHLPGSFKIGRKDSCWKNLQKHMTKYGKKEFGFMPKTYIIPQDLKALRKAWPKYTQRNFKWIIKPPASARGTGIKVINRWAQIPKRKPLIVQRYIERPLLINGSKFDLRLYVLVTSINPLRVYMYHDGLARFASVKYSDKVDTLNDRCMHLTNYSINKFSSNYHRNEDVNACKGHKWTLKSLWSYLAARGVNTARLWVALRNLVLRTILAGENAIHTMIKMNVESKYSCFELFGFDVLLDSELIPWLLEVNISPSLHSELPLDIHVKAPLVQAVLNTALYHVPPKLSADQQKEILHRQGLKGPLCYDKRLYVSFLSRAEKFKHNQFTRKDLEDRDDYLTAILQDLTPDDIRCLITSEDELSRCAPLERIFPTQHTYKYLKYTECPRYYNRLLDAWEHRYAKNRASGIQLLREFCEQKYHLEVPPSPVRRTLKIRTRTVRRTTVTAPATKIGWTLKATIKSIKRKNRKLILMKQHQQEKQLKQQEQQ